MAVIFQGWIIKSWKAFKSVSLEIAALFFMTSVLMTYLVMQDFVFERVCRVNLGYPEEVCQAVIQNNGNYTVEESNIQKVMTQIRKTRAVLDYSIPIIFVIFQGSWSDIHGRKLPLLLPCFGFILQALSLAMSYYFKHWGGFTVVLISTIPKCLSGSDVTFRMAALSYVSDISTKHGRTLRTGLISAAFTLGVPIGFAIGGALVKAAISTEVAFIISASICAAAFLIIAISVDNKPVQPDENITGSRTAAAKTETKAQTRTAHNRKCFSMENCIAVMKSLVLSFHGVSTAVRIKIFVLVFAIICINAPIQGEFGVMYLYLRKKLSWDLGNYSLYSTYVSLVGVLGTILSMGIFCSLLKLSDPVIGFIAGISQFAGCFMYTFAYTNFMIYLAPTIDMLNGTMAVVAKSMLSKLIPPQDFGKMFSFLAIVELIVPLFFDPSYSTLYEHTMDSFPGAVFLLSAILTIPPQITYVFYIWKSRTAVTCQITGSVETINSTPEATHKKNKITGQFGSSYLTGDSFVPDPKNVTLKSTISTTTLDTVVS